VLWRRESDRGFDQVEFGLNVSDPSKLHVEDDLLLRDLLNLLLNECALLPYFKLKGREAQGEVRCHRGSPSRGFSVQRP